MEHLRENLGVGTTTPRLSWQIKTNLPNWRQRAYEIECYDETVGRRGEPKWVESAQSVLIDWPFAPLKSREQIWLRVRVWGTDGSESTWSEKIHVEAGLLQSDHWKACFITPPWVEDLTKSNPAPYFRRDFELHSEIKSARLYCSALGIYEAQLNGKVIGDQVFAPGWTVYNHRLRYQTFDVTSLLKPGVNTLGAILADGWFRGRIGYGGGNRNLYGQHLALLAQLEIQYIDGSTEHILTDENWRAATGAILMSSLYDGERVDARLEPVGWSEPGFNDAHWSPVQKLDWNLDTLESPLGTPVRRIETVAAISITLSPQGKTLVDFGQNLVGRLAITVKGPSGQAITLRHAEVLENGELGTRPLRLAEATDCYILRGGEKETWEPRFTFHGFRYVEVIGWPGELQLQDIRAVVIHSDMERTGWFECSDPLLNKLHENVVWSMRGNFLDLPTDCPQRDERLGWTGDIQVFSPTAMFLYDASGFLQSWLFDLSIEQKMLNGKVPAVVPNVLEGGFGNGAAAWADAAVVVPWVLFQRSGDAGVLAAQFESMRSWVDYAASIAGKNYLMDKGFQFGDWLDPSAPPDQPSKARTDKAIVASAYFVHSIEILERAAEVLGRSEDKEKYQSMAVEARAAFEREYITPAGRLMCDAETAYTLALLFGLLPSVEQRQHAGDRLVELVRESGYHIRTGFVGTPLICDALCSSGHYLDAYRLLCQQEHPSWLYPVTMGATTIWERWDSMLPNGSINPGEMTSFNHYAFGAVADWMHRIIGGLAPADPGYRKLEICPRPGGGLTHAKTSHLTPYGLAECSWKIEAEKIILDVNIPPNTTASVNFPGSETASIEIGSGTWHWNVPYQDPDRRGPFTVDDLVGEILSEPEASKLTMDTLDRMGAPGFLKAILLDVRYSPLRQVLKMLPNYQTTVTILNDGFANLKKGEFHENKHDSAL